jgi:hypothetical protein
MFINFIIIFHKSKFYKNNSLKVKKTTKAEKLTNLFQFKIILISM